MIIPNYWTEAKKQHSVIGRQVTVRRFGWSENNLAEAEQMAEVRAEEALRRIVSGEKLSKHEPKLA